LPEGHRRRKRKNDEKKAESHPSQFQSLSPCSKAEIVHASHLHPLPMESSKQVANRKVRRHLT
jgi:hypothetical protein